MPQRDLYRYFRIEGRELLDGLAHGLIALERGEHDGDRVASMMRLAHTLKGAARVVKLPAMAEDAHAIEDVLGRLKGRAATPEDTGELHDRLQRIESAFQALDHASEAPIASEPIPAEAAGPAPPRIEPGRPLREVRVGVDELDGVLDAVDQVGARLERLRELIARLQDLAQRADMMGAGDLRSELRSIASEIPDRLTRGEQELSDVRERARQLRLVRIGLLFPALERAVHDSARRLGRQVRFEAAGADIRVDAHVLSGITDALVHLVQNAVVHGIETPEERVALGKPPEGTVRLEVAHGGHLVTVTCSDDGRGVDVDAVRESAARLGLDAPRDRAIDLVFRRGVSTAPGVSLASGRGVGLEVVQEVAQRLRGDVSVDSTTGQGVAFRLAVPVSLTSMRLLWVRVGGQRLGIPLGSVRGAMAVRERELIRGGEVVTATWTSREIPYAPLGSLIGDAPVAVVDATGVIVGSTGGVALLGVDEVLGTTDAVVRPLPELLGPAPGVLGAVLDARGDPDLVLDPVQLVRRAAVVRIPDGAPAPPKRLPALVIDDSLTTRMLVQSILESAGFEVHTAISAEQGLEMARSRRYGVILVDVEMPGMDGFEFVTQARADVGLSQIPIVMVTSRAAPEDRRRGHALGANAYVPKGEFDQTRFLDIVRGLAR